MTKDSKTRAEAALPDIEELTAVILPEPSPAVVPLDQAEPPLADEIRKRMAEIDLDDTGSVVNFGSRAQAGLQEISQKMLADVKNKDVGPAGDSLREIVTTIRGFSLNELDMRRSRSWWERVTGRAAPFARFVANYEEVQGQIDRVTADLEAHEQRLLVDIKSLDILYDRTLDFYDELALYIAAGEAKLHELDSRAIPAREAALQSAGGADEVMQAQQLRDLRARRDDLERRTHDLKLTRQVTMQSLPSIRLVQENDKSLVTKINSTLVNTVPLWETQLAQAVTIQRSAQAAGAVRDATDLTNELLTRNADNLRQANAAIRTEMERGVFDIGSVRNANAQLIATIEDSLRIADEGRARRAAAEDELRRMEGDLRDALAQSRARSVNGPDAGSEANPAPDPPPDPPEARHGDSPPFASPAATRSVLLLIGLMLAACTAPEAPAPSPPPVVQPDPGPKAPTPEELASRRQAEIRQARAERARIINASARSDSGGDAGDISGYLARAEADLIARGKLRTDRDPADAPITADSLARDFIQVALRDEYGRDGQRLIADHHDAPVRRWQAPVRMQIEWGASSDIATQSRDRAEIAAIATRLTRASGHSVSLTGSGGNFPILFLTEEERRDIAPRLQRLIPGIPETDIAALRDLAPGNFCTVFAYSRGASSVYVNAIALIRAELPPRLRSSCVHEELAQGMGLANDSPGARPSIFNDDEEFALLTRHDELLLKILYDPRLRPGMAEAEATPIVRQIARELVR